MVHPRAIIMDTAMPFTQVAIFKTYHNCMIILQSTPS